VDRGPWAGFTRACKHAPYGFLAFEGGKLVAFFGCLFSFFSLFCFGHIGHFVRNDSIVSDGLPFLRRLPSLFQSW
jgi:hypothetical protein